MARGQKEAVSVYDFLYVDARRIGVLLSQFGSDGLITELTRNTDTSSESGGGIDLKLAKMDQKAGTKSGLTRRFDPQWLLPLLFLEDTQDRLVRSIAKARLGQLVLVSGSLSILDLSSLTPLWDVPAIQQQIAAGMGNGAPAKKDRNRPDPAIKVVKDLLSIVKTFPHGIHGNLTEETGLAIWSAFRQESLMVSSSDLLISQGSEISGYWHLVGILDAMPDESDNAQPTPSNKTAIGNVVQTLAPIVRGLVGRPPQAFGVTPLLVFRTIDG